jgi:hypothetical protein
MDLFSLLQTAFIIFVSIVAVLLITSFIAYKIKHSQLNGNEKINVPNSTTNRNTFAVSKEDIVHTVALPEAGTINIVPRPIITSRKNVTAPTNTTPSKANPSRFKVVNSSFETFTSASSYEPGSTFSRSKYNIY